MAESITIKSDTQSNTMILGNPISEHIEFSAKTKYISDSIWAELSKKKAQQNDCDNTIVDSNEIVPDFDIPVYKNFIYQDYKNYFIAEQKWIGTVTKVGSTIFFAELTDLTNGGTFEVGEFSVKADVSPQDMELLKVGSRFYWSVGFAMQNGQRETKSSLRFQRLPTWSIDDIDSAADRASDLMNIF